MKKLFTLLSGVLLSASLWAQAPQKMSYQSVVRGVNNALVVEKSVGIRVSILQGSETGSAVYNETHTPTTNANGLASVSIGAGKNATSDFSKIDWSKGPYFVKTETDVAGGTNYQLTAVSELMSVPYSLHASNSNESGNGIKSVSTSGDTLYLNNGNFVIIPGVSLSNHKPTTGYGANITDNDGNTYKTVYIGTQQWMAENLKTSKYNDGTSIPYAPEKWGYINGDYLKTPAWCNYNNSDSLGEIYGKLYNWYAISPTMNGNKNVCPTGWHIPRSDDWEVLIEYLGGGNIAGGKIKEEGSTHWKSPNNGSTNLSLFSGLPGGYRDDNIFYNGKMGFDGLGELATWWSSSIENSQIYKCSADYFSSSIKRVDPSSYGFSVRCIKD
jgi:uncharacterized protein (TIGR02145 family)